MKFKKSAALALGVLMSVSASAQDFPSKTIEIVVPFGSGGGADVSARLLAPELADIFGSNVIVRNVTGASGTVGVAQVAASKPDGHTLGIAPIGPVTTQPHLRDLPYGLESFKYVCNLMLSPVLVMTNGDSGIVSIDDLIAKAKADPGSIVYGSAGPGSIPHIAGIGLNGSLGIDLKHLPQDGFANAAQNVVQVISDTITGVDQFQLVPLATYAGERLAKLPDVPTLKELGYDVPEFGIWFGLVAPADTPDAVVDSLSDACGEATARSAFQEAMNRANAPVLYMDHEAFTAFVATEFEKNGRLLQDAGLKK
jgi:tripartite-type tricarboxylate transporter receptor subunit TctC